ncbi:MAG: hypothetical protein K5656_09505 [Lachnospiraceae bacterium]|nr:hypothetical protein [Lachnospiraceae bacterium]
MLERKVLYVLDYYKKNTFMGSDGPLYFRIHRINEGTEDNPEYKLEVITWPGPFIFDKTPDEQKTYKSFDYSEAGMEEILKYLDEEKARFS